MAVREALEGFHEAGEYSSFVEVRDHVHFPSWLREVVRTRGVQSWNGLRSGRYGFGIGDGGDAGEVPKFLPLFGLAVLFCPELQDLGQVRGYRPSERTQLLSKWVRIYEYLRRRGPGGYVQEIHRFFQQRAVGCDVGPAVELSHPVLPDSVAGFVAEPAEPDDTHVLPRLRRGQEQRGRVRRRTRGDDSKRTHSRLFHEELEASARHQLLLALQRALRARDTGYVAPAQGDHPLGLLLVHVARARAVGRRVVHGDHTPHVQRPLWHPERVGDGELVVYLVRGVAVEDYACWVHDLPFLQTSHLCDATVTATPPCGVSMGMLVL